MRKHPPEPVLPEPQGLMSDVDAALMQEVLDVAQRQRVADVHHHRQADDLRARLEGLKRGLPGHLGRVGRVLPSLRPVCSDKGRKGGSVATKSQIRRPNKIADGPLSTPFGVTDPASSCLCATRHSHPPLTIRLRVRFLVTRDGCATVKCPLFRMSFFWTDKEMQWLKAP